MPDNKSNRRQYHAHPLPNGEGHQIFYESGSSRKVHHFPCQAEGHEPIPHAAGSFHNPTRHYELMQRIEKYIRDNRDECR